MCLKFTPPPIPTLDGGLNIPPIPVSPLFDAALCCKFASFPAVTTPPLPILNASTASIVDAARLVLKTFYDALPISCPLD